MASSDQGHRRSRLILLASQLGMAEIPFGILDQAEKLGVTIEMRNELTDIPLIRPGRVDIKMELPVVRTKQKFPRPPKFLKKGAR